MFTAALFMITSNWKWHKCLWTGEWINTLWYFPTMGIAQEYTTSTHSNVTECLKQNIKQNKSDKRRNILYNSIYVKFKIRLNSSMVLEIRTVDTFKEKLKTRRTLWGFQARKPFCLPVFIWVRLQPPWPSLSSKGQIRTVANQGRSSQETTWGQIKGTREAHQIRRLSTCDDIKSAAPAHTLILSATPPLNYCYKTPQILPSWDT